MSLSPSQVAQEALSALAPPGRPLVGHLPHLWKIYHVYFYFYSFSNDKILRLYKEKCIPLTKKCKLSGLFSHIFNQKLYSETQKPSQPSTKFWSQWSLKRIALNLLCYLGFWSSSNDTWFGLDFLPFCMSWFKLVSLLLCCALTWDTTVGEAWIFCYQILSIMISLNRSICCILSAFLGPAINSNQIDSSQIFPGKAQRNIPYLWTLLLNS